MLTGPNKYVSRAALKLEAALPTLKINFKDKVVLDVGASTGGFSQLALGGGARKVYAVEKGTNQLHPLLRDNPQLVSLEKTDIHKLAPLKEPVDIILIDVSFTSIREVLMAARKHLAPAGQVVVLLKPQFEAQAYYPQALNHGVIKNKTWRRKICKEFEAWCADKFLIQNKTDSQIPGVKGNVEKFYLLQLKG